VGVAVREAVVDRTRAATRWHPDQPGSWQPAGLGDDAANTMGNFAFEVTLGYRRLKKPPRSQQRVTHDI
jgi:hypothetical protein